MPSTRATSDLLDLLDKRSRAIAYDLVEPFTRVLTMAHQHCDGDLEKALIMLVITLRSSRHPAFREMEDADVEEQEVLPGFGCNVRSIADSTGVPKETVRRKVQKLIDDGWVVRNGRNLCYSVAGYRAVSQVRRSIMEMYVRGYRVVSALDAANPAA